jgi:hypothetical protein
MGLLINRESSMNFRNWLMITMRTKENTFVCKAPEARANKKYGKGVNDAKNRTQWFHSEYSLTASVKPSRVSPGIIPVTRAGSSCELAAVISSNRFPMKYETIDPETMPVTLHIISTVFFSGNQAANSTKSVATGAG